MGNGQVDIADLLLSAGNIVQGSKLSTLDAIEKLDSPPVNTSRDELEVFELQAESAPMDFFRDLEWAYNNLGNQRPRNPPSGSALHMLEWGSSARSDFMKLITGYMMKKEKEKEAEETLRDDKKKQMKIIDSLREEVQGVSSDMLAQVSDADLLAMVKARGLTLEH